MVKHKEGMNNGVSKGTHIPMGDKINRNNGNGRDATSNPGQPQQQLQVPLMLIPSWTKHGIFTSSWKDGVDNREVGRKRKRKNESTSVICGSHLTNLEQLISNEIRQCDVCARALVWTPSMEQRYFSASRDASPDRASLPQKSVAETLPRFIERHISCASPLPCSFCFGSSGINGWCGSLYCSKECQMSGEKAVKSDATKNDMKQSSAAATAAEPSSFHSIPPPKLFFCPNRFPNLDEEHRDLVREAKDSLSAIERRFQSICGYNSKSPDATMQIFGMEECALLLTTIISCIFPSSISESQGSSPPSDISSEEEGLVEELWAMSKSHNSLCKLLEKYNNTHNSENAADSPTDGMKSESISRKSSPTCQEFLQCYLDIKRSCLLRVNSPTHPLISYSAETLTSLHTLTETERDLALDLLQYSIDSSKSTDTKRESYNDGTSANNQDDVQSTILRWRKAAHFAHWVSTPNNDTENTETIRIGLQKTYFAFSRSAFRQMSHSCAPALALTIPDLASKKTNQRTPIDSLVWLVLHDILAGESTVSKLDSLEGDVLVRSADLRRLMGQRFVCSCIRCLYEQSKANVSDTTICLSECPKGKCGKGALHFSRQQLKCLADLAMQQGKFDNATKLYNIILETHPHDGDVLHARAASRLGMASSVSFADQGHCSGYFLEAQRLWREAGSIEECSSHPDIATHVEKQRVYKTLQSNGHSSHSEKEGKGGSSCDSQISFTSYMDGRCFVTDNHTPILSLKECQYIIDTAEQNAAKDESKTGGGWTTSRHYAVPTTDIPLHELTELHSLFCQIWEGKIRPLLRRQFKLTESNKSRDIFLHDVFVVRYDAKQQRYLPPHYDESTHSFIIALNSDFKGGGTFIHSLGKTLAPTVAGGMTSFSGGDLLHSGDPVVEGVRYIIAAFCYVDMVSNGVTAAALDHGRKASSELHKPSNLKGLFTNNDRKADSGSETARGLVPEKSQTFSFGFNI